MSYEGYIQCICENGHYYEEAIYSCGGNCPECLALPIWENDVDETNGESAGKIPMERFKLSSNPDLYRVPTTEEIKAFHECGSFNPNVVVFK